MGKLFQARIGLGLLLAVSCATGLARGQNPITANDPPSPGSSMPGNRELPAKPGVQLQPDIFTKYNRDTQSPHMLRELALMRGEARQKQIVEATNLLLQIAQDLRVQMANQPSPDATGMEKSRLEHIQKLAHMIRDWEKTQDDISTDLTKAGVM